MSRPIALPLLLLTAGLALAIGCAQGEGHIGDPPDSAAVGVAGQPGAAGQAGSDASSPGGDVEASGEADAGLEAAAAGTGGGGAGGDATGDAGGAAGAGPDAADEARPDAGAGGATADAGAEAAAGSTSKVYEVEDGRLSGNASRVNCASCSGGRRVALGADSTVTISDIDAPGPGTHILVLRYTNGGTKDRSIYVGVNGAASQAFWWTFEPTGGWDKVSSIALTLNGWRAGSNNSVTLFIDTELDPPDLDRIELLPDENVAGTDYCQRAHWEATASVTAGDGNGPGGAIDGDLRTRWGNNHDQDGSDWFQVDFGGIVKLRAVTLDNSQTYPNDYPGSYAVYGSVDGLTFDSSPFKTGDGAPNRTPITFKERSVKAIKIQQTGRSRADHWWQIGELTVDCKM